MITSQQLDSKIGGHDQTDDMQKLIESIKSDNSEEQLKGVTGLNKIIRDESNAQRAIDGGLVPYLINFLSLDKMRIQYEAVSCITQITAGTMRQTQVTVENGVVPALLRLLWSKETEMREQVVLSLGNIAIDRGLGQDEILERDGFVLLMTTHVHFNSRANMDLMWAVSSFYSFYPKPNLSRIADNRIISIFTDLLNDVNIKSELAMNLCKTLKGLLDKHIEIDGGLLQNSLTHNISLFLSCPLPLIDIIMQYYQSGILELIKSVTPLVFRLIKYLNVRDFVLTVLGMIAFTDSRPFDDILSDANNLASLKGLLDNSQTKIRSGVCYMLSNILGDSNTCGIYNYEEGSIINHLIKILRGDPDIGVQKEACWALSNATMVRNINVLELLASRGVVDAFIDFINNAMKAEMVGAMKAEMVGDMKAEMGSSMKAEMGSSMKAEMGSDLKAEMGSDLKAEMGSNMKAEINNGIVKYVQDITGALIGIINIIERFDPKTPNFCHFNCNNLKHTLESLLAGNYSTKYSSKLLRLLPLEQSCFVK